MPFPVSYSEEYDRVRDLLTVGERTAIGETEDRVAHNPDPKLEGRFEDSGFIYDTSAEDFILEYLIRPSGVVSFERLIDLRKPDL